jgi:hypothetical protein
MLYFPLSRWQLRTLLAAVFALLFTFASSILAFAAVSIVQISSDPYTNTTSEHRTMVEPDTYSFGSTIVSAIQSGRFSNGGSSNIGWATSTNNGVSWTNGFLPGTTVYATPAGSYSAISDPTVAYDAAHNTWIVASLSLTISGSTDLGAAVLISQSTNGGTSWSNPVVAHAASGSENLDKDWIVCDSTSTSAFYGHCYVEWDNNGGGNVIHMSTSTDGGNTWGSQQSTANNAAGIGGQPLVQPNGTVIVPIDNANETSVLAFTSTNGGTSWSSTITVASISAHTSAGGIRSGPLPTAEIDGAGKVFVVWADCRFETRCRANDMVMSTSSNGTTWSAVVRIPADAVGSGVDHFIPGLAVDKSTSGSTARLVLAYYYYPVSSCSASTCQLDIGSTSSTDGGSHWTSTTNITGPMTLSWLASTSQGRMVGDYMSTSFNSSGTAFPVFADASAPTGGTSCGTTGVTCNEGMFTVSTGLAALHSRLLTVTRDPVVAVSDAAAVSAPLTAR